MSKKRDDLANDIQQMHSDQLRSALWFLLGSIGAKEVEAAIWYATRT